MDRRHVLKMGLTAGAAGVVGSVLPLPMMREALAANPGFPSYKATVCILLHGGNDALNMLVPTSATAGSGYGTYQALRSGAGLAVNNVDLNLPVTFPTGGVLASGAGSPYYAAANASGSTLHNCYRKGVYDLSTSKGIPLGVNGLMPELARLITDNKASIIANVGTLVEPITRNEYLNNLKRKPLFLYAHNHQRRAIETGIGDNLSAEGWAGRIADDWGNVNANPNFGLNYSYAGGGRLQMGALTAPMQLRNGAPTAFKGLDITKTSDVNRRAAFKALISQATDPFKSLYSRMLNDSMGAVDQLRANWPATSSFAAVTNAYGAPLFSLPNLTTTGLGVHISNNLIPQMESVAEMINIGRNTLGLKRQFFVVQLGGFDTHADQVSKHPLLLRELSTALYDFQMAMESLGIANEVTSFTVSDFGRTSTVNNNGTDHAWGSNQLVIGGDGTALSPLIGGGTMMGTLPNLTPGGIDDASTKGRMIPTIATDQYAASIARWFGVDDALMPNVFPNLANFGTLGATGTAYLPII
ncbi:MAG: DUF1501 domain-containing protein [Ghiorsea sp.]|nr:DUF1501 domain-containing protein [Ghiorsea sp.]